MLKFFTSDLRRNIIKTVCLTLGLSVGFLLVATVYFQLTYDNFIPDIDRIYKITESGEQNGEYQEYNSTPGATAPGLKRYAPQVEVATRATHLFGETLLQLEDGRKLLTPGLVMADSCFFDVVGRPIIAGDPHEALSVKDHCMIPRSLAEKIGGDVIGMTFTPVNLSDSYKATISGVYEDFPLNSSFPNQVILSLASIGTFMWDGSDNWMGNDRYQSIVRLQKGATPEDVKPYIEKMLRDNADAEALDIFKFNHHLRPLKGRHAHDNMTMILIMAVLSVLMLMSAALNYLLVVIGQMGRRGKEMAVRKCFGTSNLHLFMRVMAESIFFLAVSFGLALLIAFSFPDLVGNIFGYTPSELLTVSNVWIVEGAVCLALLLITGAVPAWMYCRTPVAVAFRGDVRSRRGWKLILLFVQFFASSMLVCLLSLAVRQYSMMSNADYGMDYENIGFASLDGLDQNQRATICNEIAKLSDVEGVATAYQNFLENASGNNVWTDNRETEVNVDDMYYADPEIINVLGMKLLQGGTFHASTDTLTGQAIVDERFARMMSEHFGMNADNLIGERFRITEHNGLDGTDEIEIVGVVGNLRRGGFIGSSTRGGVMFPTTYRERLLYVRFNELSPEAIAKAQKILDEIAPLQETRITPYREQVKVLNRPVKQFGISVMLTGIAVIIIALIGLVGYVADEVLRRRREIAIRKVSGTPAAKIVRLFCIDILRIAVPATILGAAVAVIVGRKWLSQFSEQVSMSPLVMSLCVLLVLGVIAAVVIFNSMNIARTNPVDNLRNE